MPTPTRRHRKGRLLPHLDHCLNCHRPTGPDDNFCPNCGQQNEDATVSFKPLVADALSEMASWDSKLLRTVIPLLFRPGFLTNEFLAGRRIRYLSPLKMYLVISAVFFLILPFSHLTDNLQVDPGGISTHAATPHQKRISISDDSERSEKVQIVGDDVPLTALPKTVAAYDARQRDTHTPHHDGFWKALVSRQVIKARANKQTFTQSVIQGLIGDLPKMMFVLLPLFALLLKMTYLRRKRLYIEHLIFALHSHAFLFILLTLAVLTPAVGVAPGLAWEICAVLVPMYLLVALRRVYQQGWPKTAVKFLWLAFNYVILLSVAFAVTAVAAFLLA